MKIDSVATMYVDIAGKRIENTTTEKISNTIKKTINQEAYRNAEVHIKLQDGKDL